MHFKSSFFYQKIYIKAIFISVYLISLLAYTILSNHSTICLYISIPKSHFLAEMKGGVHFSEIDGQSFLVANNLGIWDEIVSKFLPKSKFFPQSMDNLYEIINASSIPSFYTNISLPLRFELDRVNLPILDEEASVEFYLVYKKQSKQKLKNFLNVINKDKSML